MKQWKKVFPIFVWYGKLLYVVNTCSFLYLGLLLGSTVG